MSNESSDAALTRYWMAVACYWHEVAGKYCQLAARRETDIKRLQRLIAEKQRENDELRRYLKTRK